MNGMNEYGNALFLLASEEGTVETVKGDLDIACTAIEENPDYIKLLDTPAVAKEERLSLINEAFCSLHYSVKNLIMMLCEKRIVYTLSDIRRSFSVLYDEHFGIERVEAVTAVALTEAQTEALTKKLVAMTGKTIVIKNTVKPEILGGVMLRYSGIQLDGSVKSRLDSFSESLKNLNL